CMVSDSGVLQAVVISDWVPINGQSQDKKDRNYWVWTKDYSALHFQGADVKLMDNEADKINEMGIIPFHLFNDELPVENEKPYLHPDILLQNTNLFINKALTDGGSLIEYQIYGQPYMIGGDADSVPDQTGHNQFLHIQRGTMGDQESIEVGILQPKADFEGLLKFIERVANGYGTTRGLAPDSFSARKSGAPQSGISLKLENHVLVEMRDSEESKYDELENELFPIIRAVHNFQQNREGGHDLEEISEDVKLQLDFSETDEAFENEAENQRQGLAEVSQGLLKPSDFVRRRFPRMSADDAIAYLNAAKEEKEGLGLMTSLTDIDNALNDDEGDGGA
ncbi:MAG: hypothetical protein VX803_12090, partial [Pseudomonadota bacterium]|nr:hypothetical protein [Pseudomonadota bacterium]